MDFLDAVKRGDAETVARMLDEDRSLLTAKSGNVSAILLALYHGQAAVARLFTERGAALSFHEACALGDAGRVRELLDADPSLLDARSADGFPALGLAIFFRQPEVARFLMERGADVNAAAENPQRVAPLHAAAAVRDVETVRLLLARGADPNAKQQNDYTPLHGAASRGDVAIGELLIRKGADPYALSADGKTPAAVARERGEKAFAEWLEAVTT